MSICSVNDRSAALRSRSVSAESSKCRKLRPSRSSFQTTRVSPGARSAIARSGPGRDRNAESGTARLEEAVTAHRDALLERTRDRVPLDWAATQNNLGTELWRLGERESGTARLEEAVSAHRDALLEYTRDRVPLDWAMTQNNLGNALVRLGERESGTARLEEAVRAYRNALLEYTSRVLAEAVLDARVVHDRARSLSARPAAAGLPPSISRGREFRL